MLDETLTERIVLRDQDVHCVNPAAVAVVGVSTCGW